MNRRLVFLFAVALLVGGVFWGLAGWLGGSPLPVERKGPESGSKQLGENRMLQAALAAEPRPVVTPLAGEEEVVSEIERNKAVDRANMTQIRAGIFAYLAKHGHYPEYLTQLVPEFVEAGKLYSPGKKPDAIDWADIDHKDPGMAKPSYGYEFSNLVYRDGRTFAEIKEVQRREWGDVVPLLRCFAYGEEVMNMAYGGDIYDTKLNWEWDAATMDLVEKYGWGPGLTTGEFVKVQVLQPNGQPAANAEVWADGRTFSFSLPNRPFPTDAAGWATIPVGVDLDRTALSLRAVTNGMASATVLYPMGNVPESGVLSLAPVVSVGGTAVDATGKAMANTRIYLRNEQGGDRTPNVTLVRTDKDGRWKAGVNAQDVQGLSAVIGVPAGPPVRNLVGQPLDAEAVRAGTAVVRWAE